MRILVLITAVLVGLANAYRYGAYSTKDQITGFSDVLDCATAQSDDGSNVTANELCQANCAASTACAAAPTLNLATYRSCLLDLGPQCVLPEAPVYLTLPRDFDNNDTIRSCLNTTEKYYLGSLFRVPDATEILWVMTGSQPEAACDGGTFSLTMYRNLRPSATPIDCDVTKQGAPYVEPVDVSMRSGDNVVWFVFTTFDYIQQYSYFMLAAKDEDSWGACFPANEKPPHQQFLYKSKTMLAGIRGTDVLEPTEICRWPVDLGIVL